MCGISGAFCFGKTESRPGDARPSLEKITSSMNDAIAHRGVDGHQIWSSSNRAVCLGHRRLAILDLSSSGAQPMKSSDDSLVVTFNGEIYNYLEIAKELKAEGIELVAHCDTTVLLAAFKFWGKDCLKKFRGMFAFAIWDQKKQELFCARDQLGIKPFYWWSDGNTFIFSSEIKGILASGLVPRIADNEAISLYLQFYCIPQPRTILKDVKALMPGHSITISVSDGLIGEQYFDLSEVEADESIGQNEAEKIVRNGFLESVSLHLRSDVPVGLFLSGGIDSASLAGVVAKVYQEKELHTFSIGFKDKSNLDESGLAAVVANKVGSTHHKMTLEAIDLKNNFDDFIQAIDQPSGDGLNSFFVSKIASDYVKVALSGLGGDEIFLGYRYMKELFRMHEMERVFGGKNLIKGLSYFSKFGLGRSFLYRSGLRFAQLAGKTDKECYEFYRSLRDPGPVSLLFKITSRTEFGLNNIVEPVLPFRTKLSVEDRLNRLSKAELSFYTTNMLLRDADATSMASTIELRVPFLETKFVQDALRIKSALKIKNGGVNKPLFVSALQDFIPKEVLSAKKKGFEMPVGNWLKARFENELEDLKNINWLDSDVVEKELFEFKRDQRNYLKVWSLLVLKKWLEFYDVEIIQINL
jgi:asparagine synthase (glutamine-hydrolysing)